MEIIKIDADTGKPLVGAVIRISNLSGSMTVDKTTDENGEIKLDKLPQG